MCVGRNYREHAAELGNKVNHFFLFFFFLASGLTNKLFFFLGPNVAVAVPEAAKQLCAGRGPHRGPPHVLRAAPRGNLFMKKKKEADSSFILI